ncbi:MAG TPA: hypothetical protein DCG49_02345 [Ruminococcus sp.]|nr:hypothetical protein [Ruminococcus sp.]
MKYKGIIFDMDGTLLDSMEMWRGLDRRFLRENGIEPPADISEIVKNMTVERSAEYFTERFSLNMTPQQVIERVEAIATDEYRFYLPLKDGAKAFLEQAAARKIPCALASVTYRSLLDAALERLGIAQYFKTVLTPDAEIAGKHDPAIYRKAAEILGTAPAETIVIEDALYAAETAKQAGFFTVGFRDITGKEEWEKLTALCDITVDTWQALAEALNMSASE